MNPEEISSGSSDEENAIMSSAPIDRNNHSAIRRSPATTGGIASGIFGFFSHVLSPSSSTSSTGSGGRMGHFEEMYKVQAFERMLPVPSKERLAMLEYGGKVIMPQSALEQLSRLRIVYPMMFKVQREGKKDGYKPEEDDKTWTYCGVLEFCAPEGFVFLPTWVRVKFNNAPFLRYLVINLYLSLYQ